MTEAQGPPPPPPPTEPPAPPPPPGYQPPAPASGEAYPVRAEIQRQEEYSRFMPLIKWLLAFPHYIALLFLGIAALFVILISFFAVIFTREYPRGMFDFMVGVHRWAWRVQAYVLLAVDPYPPFTLDDDPSYPATFTIDYPEAGVDRWRPLVHWLLIIPYAIVAYLLLYLGYIIVFFAFFTILLNAMRWSVRASAYEYWLTTKYPPFEWEQ